MLLYPATVGRDFDESEVGRNAITHGKHDQVADDDVGSGNRLQNLVADHGRVLGDETLDRLHDTRCLEVDDGIERRRDDNDEQLLEKSRSARRHGVDVTAALTRRIATPRLNTDGSLPPRG